MADQQQEQQAVPQPGTPEYDAAMAAKFDGQQPPASTPEPAVKPDHVPEKFWDAAKGVVNYEAWAKSTQELEAKFTQQNQKPTEEKPAGEQPPADNPDAQKAAEELSSKGLDLMSFNEEFAKSGSLSDASYEKLEKAGISKEVVDSFIAGQQALASQRDSVGIEAAGGQEKWNEMAEWAKTGLSAGERKLFNEAVAKGSVDEIKFAVAGLRARFEAVNGRDPALIGGDKGGPGVGFRSHAEMTAAMKDPRYQKDPAYRKDVEQKVANSTYW